jgi:class 3 adenylate cyclase
MSESRKLAAILVTDIVGYSRLTGADEERTLARVRGLRSDLIEPTIAAHRGRVVKRTGDGSIVEFRSVVDAVRCAIEVQTGLLERNAGVPPERRIECRVGVHLGDVVEESDGELMGDGVNIAARLEGVAKPGAICLSEQAYWQVKGRLDLKVTDLGATQLKNIAEPIRIYSLEIGQQQPQAEPAPMRSTMPADHQAAIKRIRAKRSFRVHATVYVAVNLLLIAIWALTEPGHANHRHGDESDFWPIWPILGWGVGLAVHYWSVFVRRPISDDEVRREMEKER